MTPNCEGLLNPTEVYLLQLCQRYSRQYPDPQHPVRSELVAAFVPRVVRLFVLRHLASDALRGIEYAVEILPESGNAIKTQAAKILQTYSRDLASQIVELDTWLHEPGVDEAECGNWLTANGYQYQEVLDLVTRAKRYQAGRKP